MTKNSKNEVTSRRVGSIASKLLRSSYVSAGVKAVAASALTQRPKRATSKKGK